MLRVKKALKLILDSISPLGTEEVKLGKALDRVLAKDLYSPLSLPPFDNSAMDGFALRTRDTAGISRNRPGIFRVIENLPAGTAPEKRVGKNQAARIMTGAPIPEGADSVVMVEDTAPGKTGTVLVFRGVSKGKNLRKAGEDIKKGQKILSGGVLLRPQELGLLSALGICRVKVGKRPRVGILATGNELARPGEKLKKGQIYNSNSELICGQVEKSGGLAIDLGTAPDNTSKIRKHIRQGLGRGLDLLLVMGGISVGDYDLVKKVLFDLGLKMSFWKIAQRPGKPLAFGRLPAGTFLKKIPVFGLPGNPVSSSMTFEEFVRPVLLKMQGTDNLFRPFVRAVLEEDFQKVRGLRYFVRVRLRNSGGKFYARPTGPQGSGIISSLVLADGIMVLSEEKTVIRKGETLPVRLLRHGYDFGVI